MVVILKTLLLPLHRGGHLENLVIAPPPERRSSSKLK